MTNEVDWAVWEAECATADDMEPTVPILTMPEPQRMWPITLAVWAGILVSVAMFAVTVFSAVILAVDLVRWVASIL